jgi:two-component system, OmpR family, sensor histidine kinase KdpD
MGSAVVDGEGWPVIKPGTVQRELRGVTIALLLVGATSIVAFALAEYLQIRRGAVIFLIPVLVAGLRLGLIPALVAAAAGVAGSSYFFYSPFFNIRVAELQELLNLTLFTVVAVVVSHLANTMKRQTEIARTREREMGDLYAFSKRLAAAPTAGAIHNAIRDHLANLVQRNVVLFGTGRPPSGTDAHDSEPVPDPVRAEIDRARQNPGLESTVKDGSGNTWLVRRVSPATPDFGVIAIDLGNVSGHAVADIRQRIAGVLADAAATLERLDVARALNEARMRSETEHLRDALIGSVSHELRTPLASILGAATVLCEARVLKEDSRLRALANVVREEAERLDNEIQNLLDATRISRHEIKPHLQWVEPVDIVNSALERRRRRMSGHTLALAMDSDLPIVHVDPTQVQQALMQLLDNAAKYSPSGTTINVAARRNGRHVELLVADCGAGVTTEESARIGERFFRGPRLAASTPGSGLGLWIANSFIAANGGTVAVKSAGAGRGTTVLIHLPLSLHTVDPEMDSDD